MNEELKKFVGLKKNDFVLEWNKQYYKHDKITVCVLDATIVFNDIYPDLQEDSELVTLIKKKFPELKYDRFTSNGFDIHVVGKSVCSELDTFDSHLGETIAYSKAQGKAYSIASRVMKCVASYMSQKIKKSLNVSEFMRMAADRAKRYVEGI